MHSDCLTLMSLILLIFVSITCGDGTEPEEPCLDVFGRPCEWSSYPIMIDSRASFSPTNTHVAFVRKGGQNGDGLHIAESLGQNPLLIVGGDQDLFGIPSWSPDGQWLVFQGGDRLFTVNLSGTSGGIFLDTARYAYPMWSSDGMWIYYSKLESDNFGLKGLWRIRPDKSERQFLDDRIAWGGNPADSSFINLYFDNGSVLVRFFPFGNGVTDTLSTTANGNSNSEISFSPDGSKIAFHAQRGPNGSGVGFRFNIWVVNSNDTGLQQLTIFGGEYPSWTRDGQWIVYTNTDSTGRLWMIKPDGSEKKQFTFD